MNFEPSFLIVGFELVSTRSYTMSVQATLTCISATVFKSRYDYQLREGRGPRLNVIMTLIFLNSLEVSPKSCDYYETYKTICGVRTQSRCAREKTYPDLHSLSCSCHRRDRKGKCHVYCWLDSGKRVFIYLKYRMDRIHELLY